MERRRRTGVAISQSVSRGVRVALSKVRYISQAGIAPVFGEYTYIHYILVELNFETFFITILNTHPANSVDC